MRLILIGGPGSGKGTQGEMLASELGVPHISTGGMIREMCATDGQAGALYRDQIASGNFIPDSDMVAILAKRLLQPDARMGYILDGFPRDLAQATLFDSTEDGRQLDAAIELRVDDSELTERLEARLICPSCGASYHSMFAPPVSAGICDRDGAALIRRADDEPDSVRRRLRVYHEQTEPLIEHYRQLGKLVVVNGSSAPSEVFRKVSGLLLSGAAQSSNA